MRRISLEIPKEVVIGKSKELFGEKIYSTIEVVDAFVSSLEGAEEQQRNSIKNLAKDITESFADGFTNLKGSFNLNTGQTSKLKDSVNTAIEDIISEKGLTLSNQVKELEEDYESKKQAAELTKDENSLQAVTQQYEEKKEQIEKAFVEEINKEVEKTINTVVEDQIEKVEQKKKKTTEDDVRDHLRGFARTIPAFLMAYGDDNTKLANFEKNIDKDTFEELTSITIDEFKKLRDGFEYFDDNEKTIVIPGLFNQVVFNASIQEFFDTKNRLANYFNDSLQEDIFDYIPPQKTNQIFTPKHVVKLMVDILEKENPGIFSDKTKRFADLYVKSGLYITEIVKKLNDGLKDQIPNQKERIKWILENQVYACAPSNIIYNIVKNFIYSEVHGISTNNLRLTDTMKLASEEKLSTDVNNIFGDDSLKFDVIIGNPSYQDETENNNRATPIYNLFMEESYKIAEKVVYITPARFLFNAGQTPSSWNTKMLNDPHFKVTFYEAKSAKVFPNTDIKGGVAISYRDESQNFGAIEVFISNDILGSIAFKVKEQMEDSVIVLHHNRSSYKLTDQVYEDNPSLKGRAKSSERNMIGSNIFDKLPEIFLNEIQDSNNFIKVYGRQDNSRMYKQIKRAYVSNHPNLDKWKVFVAKSNGTGAIGEALSPPEVAPPNTISTQTFISFGGFTSEYGANSFAKYIKCKFTRSLLSVKKVTPDNARKDIRDFIPIQDFEEKSDIDWSKPVSEVDQQLYEKYNLNQKEIQFIEDNVREME